MQPVQIIKAIMESFKQLDYFHTAVFLCVLALGVVALSLLVVVSVIKRG
jgi:hypothetical protein